MRSFSRKLAAVCLLMAISTSAMAMPGDGLQQWRQRLKHNKFFARIIALLDPPPENKISIPPP